MEGIRGFVIAAVIAGILGAIVPPLMYALQSDPDTEAASRPRLVATSSGGGAPAATPPPPPAGAVVVGLLDALKLEVSTASTAAGAVTFRAENKGAIIHELAVFKTDLPPASIPLSAGKADESRVQVVGRTKNLNGKAYEDLRVNLTPGNHVLVCNIPAHYQSGMYAAFTVQ
jgi:hypothetical protein